MYMYTVSILAFHFPCSTSAHTFPSSKILVGDDKCTPNHTCPSKHKEIIANIPTRGENCPFGTLLSAKFYSLYSFIFKFLLLCGFGVGFFCWLFVFPKEEKKRKNPLTFCSYKLSSISNACKFFYLWLFGSHERCASCHRKATLESRTNTPLLLTSNCSALRLVPQPGVNGWAFSEAGRRQPSRALCPEGPKISVCRFCQVVRAQFI